MTTTINASNSGSGGLIQTADASGVLALQTAGTTAVTVDTSQNVGIGTTSPNSSAKTTIKATGTNTYQLQLEQNNATDGYGLRCSASDGDLTFNRYASSAYTETMRLTSGANLKFNSGYGSVATAYGCRAWVNFNGQGTIAITGSGNVSSLTDIAAGRYNVNLTTAMPDAVYSVVTGITKGGGGPSASNSAWSSAGEGRSSGYFLLEIYDWNFNGFDSAFVQAAIFR